MYKDVKEQLSGKLLSFFSTLNKVFCILPPVLVIYIFTLYEIRMNVNNICGSSLPDILNLVCELYIELSWYVSAIQAFVSVIYPWVKDKTNSLGKKLTRTLVYGVLSSGYPLLTLLILFKHWQSWGIIMLIVIQLVFTYFFSTDFKGDLGKFYHSLLFFWASFLGMYFFFYPVECFLKGHNSSVYIFMLLQSVIISLGIIRVAKFMVNKNDDKSNDEKWNIIKLILGSLIFPIIVHLLG